MDLLEGALDAPKSTLVQQIKAEANNPLGEPLKLAGAYLAGADLSGLDLMGADFAGANLERANLSGARLFKANLSGAEMTGTDLGNANLEEADLTKAGLGMANLENARLFKANLRDSTLTKARLTNADLRCTCLWMARVRDANLTGADFTGADMQSADLSASQVKNADFGSADLREAMLHSIKGYEKANWVGTDIRGVNFTGAYRLSRFIKDQNYIKEFRESSRWAALMYYFWWATSDCGRSILRWFVVIFFAAMAYAGLYTFLDIDYGDHEKSWFLPIYFSVVTLTTLGYGDIVPSSVIAQIVVLLEVITGYVMLGGLLSIFNNKISRRAE